MIPSAAVDTSTIIVSVQASSSDITTEVYTLNTDYTTLGSTSLKYFLQEVEGGRYEVYFGDGVIGKKPIDGNIVILDYVVTSGSTADGASAFTPASTVGGYSNVTALAYASSSGGGDSESVDSIKFNAPKTFSSQKRAVSAEDYKALIKKLTNLSVEQASQIKFIEAEPLLRQDKDEKFHNTADFQINLLEKSHDRPLRVNDPIR